MIEQHKYSARYYLDKDSKFYIYGSNVINALGLEDTKIELVFDRKMILSEDIADYDYGCYNTFFKTNDNVLYVFGNTEKTFGFPIYTTAPMIVAENVSSYFCTDNGVIYNTFAGDLVEIGTSAGGREKNVFYHNYKNDYINPYVKIDFITSALDIRILGVTNIVDNKQVIVCLGDVSKYGIKKGVDNILDIFNTSIFSNVKKVEITTKDIYFLTLDNKLYSFGESKYLPNQRSSYGEIMVEVDDIKVNRELDKVFIIRKEKIYCK